ncbi:MAG: AI-2E family transporter, partial [Spirochaetia bacterium]|nr:AI-2E family transporter [Spirochaetia bacterium]
FFAGQLLEAVILGLLCTLGMMAFRFPYALTIGTVVGITALIPMIGAYLGGAIGFVLIFPDNFKLALLFILFLIVLQQLEGNLIYPRVVGSSVGLPGIWVFAAIIIGGGLWGILGILFGVPAAASLYRLVRMDMAKRKRLASNAT